MNIGIYLTSRNNYLMLEEWAKIVDTSKYKVLNIDEDSNPKEKEFGKLVCKKYNIQYLDREESGMQFNAITAIKHFSDAKHLIWFQHDCWPISENFLDKLDQFSSSGRLDNFGNIGFNGIASDVLTDSSHVMKRFNKGKRPLGVLARSGLTDRKWLSGEKTNKFKTLPSNDNFRKPFSIESTAWFANMFNVQLYNKYIKPDSNFVFFHSWDDVSFQFLNNNIHNIVLPDFYIEHSPDFKPKLGLPLNSTKLAKKGDDTFHRGWGHIDTWK